MSHCAYYKDFHSLRIIRDFFLQGTKSIKEKGDSSVSYYLSEFLRSVKAKALFTTRITVITNLLGIMTTHQILVDFYKYLDMNNFR